MADRASEIRDGWDRAKSPDETFYKKLAGPFGDMLAAEVIAALAN